MSDTTEAMRAALVALESAGIEWTNEGLRAYHDADLVLGAVEKLKAALAHPTPAAPAVTESTHTGVAPELTDAQIDAALQHGSKWDHPGDEVMYLSRKEIKEAIREAVRLAAQPSPERNDCEPVVPDAADLATHSWPIQEGGMRLGVPNGVLLVHKPTGIGVAVTRHRSQHQNRDDARARLFAMLAPPPPAERHYCERCGKRLGHTGGVHTCTPPREAAGALQPNHESPANSKPGCTGEDQ